MVFAIAIRFVISMETVVTTYKTLAAMQVSIEYAVAVLKILTLMCLFCMQLQTVQPLTHLNLHLSRPLANQLKKQTSTLKFCPLFIPLR